MAVTLLVFTMVAAASAAPPFTGEGYVDWQKELLDRAEFNKLQEAYLAKRSNFGYVSPCAAAAPPPMSYAPAYAASSPYLYNHPAYQTVPLHHGHASSHYPQPFYRMDEEGGNEQEIMGFSDMDHATVDHVPMARYAYAGASTSPVVAGIAGQAAASGPVVGVFSNANVGGCSVPLLVSCSPSISHGRIVKTQKYYDNTSAPAQQGNLYRAVEDPSHQDEIKEHQEKAALSSEHTTHSSKMLGDNRHQ